MNCILDIAIIVIIFNMHTVLYFSYMLEFRLRFNKLLHNI